MRWERGVFFVGLRRQEGFLDREGRGRSIRACFFLFCTQQFYFEFWDVDLFVLALCGTEMRGVEVGLAGRYAFTSSCRLLSVGKIEFLMKENQSARV